MSLFSLDELQIRTGNSSLTQSEHGVFHDQVSDMIEAEVGDLLDDPPQPGVRTVALEVGRALAVNPSNLASKTIGPLSETYARGQGGSGVRPVELSRSQRMALRRAVGMRVNATIHTAAALIEEEEEG